jgi:hypothetical protein
MKVAVHTLWLFLLAGCNASVPQRSHWNILSVAPLEAEMSDADKNAYVRQLVRDIRARYGSNSILAVRSGGADGRRFIQEVRLFGERGAIAYHERGANFEVRFFVSQTTGSFTGPGIGTYEVTASLVRLSGINEGAEVISTSTKRGSCNDKGGSRVTCKEVQTGLASRALYSFKLAGAPL